MLQNPAFQPEMTRFKPPGGVYVHIAGIDVVRVDAETFYVLEDNARTPSGVSYMLENREAMMRLLPELFGQLRIAPVDNYPDDLLKTLRSVAPRAASRRADGGAADARPVQLGLLRALLPGRQDGRGAGRGPRPVRARQHRLHAHDRRAAARRRHLPAHRRRVSRSDGLQSGFDAGRPGPAVGLQGRQRHHLQRGRHRRLRRQGDLQLHARDREVLSSARSRS